jgi:hypothetical protein
MLPRVKDVGTRGLGRSMLWAVVSYFVTTLGTMLTNYLTSADVSPLEGALISTGVGLAVVLIGVFLDFAKNVPQVLPSAQPSGGLPPKPRGRRMPLVLAIVITLALCGAGGLGATYGVQWAGSKAVAFFKDQAKPDWEKKTEETGTQRLASPVSKRNGVLTVAVKGVEVTGRATKVSVTARNSSADAIRLPTFGSCQITVPGAATLKPDPAAGDWAGDVPAGGELTGTIVFDGTIGPAVSKVTLTFTSIFGGFDAPRNISVEIPLNTNS